MFFSLIKNFVLFGKSNSLLDSFHKLHDETVTHILYKCIINQKLGKQLYFHFEHTTQLSP